MEKREAFNIIFWLPGSSGSFLILKYLLVLMRTRLLAAFNGLPSLYQSTAGTGLPLVRQRRINLCCFFTVTDSSSPYATGDRAVKTNEKEGKKQNN